MIHYFFHHHRLKMKKIDFLFIKSYIINFNYYKMAIYNKSYDVDIKNIDMIIKFFEDYKINLRSKEFQIFKKNIQKILDFMKLFEKNLIEEVTNLKNNDSDNEENYDDEYKNCEKEDSVSEYDTDTDDENTINLRNKFVVKISQIKNYNELVKSRMPVKFKKIS